MNRFVFFFTVLLVSGCASIPNDLRSASEQALMPFSSAASATAQGQNARWGGEIAQVRNLAQGSELEVVQFSLNASGRPLKTDTSGGRFKVQVAGFIDPAIYAPGRLVTVLGTFTGIEQGKVGEQDYSFPILKSDRAHLWPEIQDPPPRCDCEPFFNSPLMMRPVIIVPAK